MYTGQAVGKGFEQSGKSSAYLKTVDYEGFASASQGLAPGGVMFFSGSVLTSSGDNYEGVGLELFANTESFLRFRSSPSELDIRTNAFFVGTEDTQFISASGGIIEISSSKFHLQPDGDVIVAGTIEASDGKIGGFHISESRINSENEKIILKSSGQISASSLLLASGSFVVDPDNLSRFGQDGFQSFVMVENTGVVIQTSNFNLNTARFIISSSDVGMMAVGSTPPTAFNSGKGFYVDGDGNLLIGESTGPRIQFDGFETIISSSTFFLGSDAQFVSGANGNVEISSSNFHLDATGNVNMAGTITAEAGEIGGFSIGQGALSSTNFFISGAASDSELFISSSGFSVDAQGVVSASDLSLQGGDVGGLSVSEGTVSVGEILKLKDSGQITGSQVLFTGGKISGSALDIIVPKFFLGSEDQFVSGSNGNIEISSSNFHLDKDGTVRMAGTITATAGEIGGFGISSNSISSSNNNLIFKDSGQITGSTALFTGGKIAGWTISGTTLVGNNATLDGAGSALFKSDAGPDTDNSAAFDEARNEYYIDFTPEGQGNTRNFFVKFGPNFMVDSDGILIASGATFAGTITASAGLIGGFVTDSSSFHDHSNNIFISGSPRIGGTHHPSFMFISSSNFNIKQSGDITGSQVLFTGGKIGGFEFGTNTFTATNFELDPSGKRITLGTGDTIFIADGDEGIQLGDATFADAPFSVTTAGVLKATSGTVGGFTIDADEIKSTNLLLDSTNEKITVGSANAVTIQGGGTDNSIRMGSKTAFAQATTAGVILGMDSTIPTLEMFKDANNKFIFNNSGVEIKAETFDLATPTLLLDSGTNSGKIALGSTPPTAFNSGNGVYFDGTGKALIGSSTGSRIEFDGTDVNISSSAFLLGNVTNFISGSNGNLRIQSSGETTLSGSGVNILTPQFMMGKLSTAFISGSNGNIQISSSAFHLDRDGNVTMSGSIQAQDGTIGGFTINPSTITATNFTLDPGNKFISLGSGDDIFIADADTGIQLGDATFSDAPFSVTKGGVLKATVGAIGGFGISATTISSSNNNLILRNNGQITGSEVLFTGGKIAGFDISGNTFVSSDSNFTLDASNRKISLGSSNNVFIADADDGIQLGHATFASAPFSVTKGGVLKATSGTIGGWSLGSDRIFSDNINITSTGTIETSDFASGVKGWRISALNNGTAEFENATIRGTMKTAVFEKETVNAVGGQLYVANSTVLSGSGTVSASFNTMSVDNVSGFTGSYGGSGEILSLKKVTDTGFSTEYVFVQSASRKDPGSDTDFSGQLFVIRGYSGSFNEGVDSGSLGDTPNPAQDYEPGQVVVSTGISGSGFIRINANPTDITTPYIDIVERTGSAIYDIELKARLGDLSGLSSALVGTRGGFGLFTERAFLTKDVTVGTLGTEHVKITSGSIRFRNFETTLAELRGSTWTLGGAHGDTSDTVVIDGDGVTIFGNDASTGVFVTDDSVAIKADGDDDKVTLGNAGMTVTTDGVDVAEFGADTVIRGGTITIQGTTGGGNDDRLVIGNASVSLFTNDVKQVDINDNGLNIGPSANAGNAVAGNVRLSSDGVHVYGAQTNDFVFVKSDGVDVVTQGDKVAFFGATSSIGNVSNGHISMSSAGLFIQDGTTTRAQFGSDVTMQGGTITLNGTTGTVGHDRVVIGSADIGIFTNNEKKVHINDAGMNIGPAADAGAAVAGNVRLGSTGAYVYGASNDDYVFVKSDGVEVVSAGSEVAEFGAITTIGNTSTEHVRITSTALELKDGGTTHLSMSSAGLQIGSVSDGITLDASGNATFNGSITLPAGTVSGSAQLAAAISGSNNADSASAAAQAAALALASASMATQVVLNSNGMDLNNVDGDTLASYGTTVTIGQATGTNQNVFIDSDSVDIRRGTQVTASFGATTTIGSTLSAHTFIDSGSFRLNDFTSSRLVMDHNGIRMGPQFSVDRDGNASFGGTLTVSAPVPTGTVSGSAQLSDAISGSSGAVSESLAAQTAATLVDSASVASSVQITSAGLNILNNTPAVIAEYGANIFVGLQNAEHVKIGSAGFEIKDDSTVLGKFVPDGIIIGDSSKTHISASTNSVNILTNGKVSASFGTTTTIGSTDAAHTLIDSGSFRLKDGSDVRLQMDANGIRMGDQFSVDSSGNASFGGTLTISNIVSGSAQLADAISGSSGAVSASLAADTAATLVDSASVAASVQITSAGMNILNGSGAKLAEYGTTVTIGQDADDKSRMVLGATSLDLIVDAGGTDTNFASFGAVTRIGDVANEHISMSSAGMTIKDGGDVIGKFVAGGATLGKTAGAHISASTLDVHIIKDSDNKAVLDSDSFDIVLNGATSASFGATTTIGSAIGQHVKITNDAFEIKTDANTTVLSASSAGLEMQGTVRATAGEIGGFSITPTAISSSNNQVKLVSNGDFQLGDLDSQFIRGLNSSGTIEISSSGYHLKTNGEASLAGGTINFTNDGKITSDDFLIERSRLFGAGEDGGFDLTTGRNQSSLTSDDDGGDVFVNTSEDVWTLQRDVYASTIYVRPTVTLQTNGFRIFVNGQMLNKMATIDNSGATGSDGGSGNLSAEQSSSGGAGGAGGVGGTLHSGSAGGDGGSGNHSYKQYAGGAGGGAGGSGGTIFIFCRTFDAGGAGGGVIRAKGGNGGDGGQGGQGGANTNPGGLFPSGFNTAAASGAPGGAASATTRLNVVDPHVIIMMRDVMSASDTAARLRPSAGSGGGGSGHAPVSNQSGGALIATGDRGFRGQSATNTIVSSSGARGGTGGAHVAAAFSNPEFGTSGCGGGGGGGGVGGAIVICTTTEDMTAAGQEVDIGGGIGGQGGAPGPNSATSHIGESGSAGENGDSGSFVYIRI